MYSRHFLLLCVYLCICNGYVVCSYWSNICLRKVVCLCFIMDKDKDKNRADNKKKFVIDNDAGGDDAMAIFMALLYEKHYDGPKLVGLTTANGNTIEDNVFVNNQKILKVAGRQDVPIYRGAKSSIVTTPTTTAYYGIDGLGDTGEVYDNLIPAKQESAVEALIQLSKDYKDELTVITVGTLTNVALAIKMDPDFLSRLEHLYVGAGHIQSETEPSAEFNAHMDVEAYHIVAQHASPDKVTALPFSQVKKHLNYTKEWRNNVLGAIDTKIMKAQNKFEKVSLDKESEWSALDPAVIAAFLRNDLVEEYKYSKNDIIVCGESRGLNTNTICEKNEANIRLIDSLKTEEFTKFYLEIFSKTLD